MLFNSCSEITRKLSAYLDGELESKDQAAVKEHLSVCHDCAAELRRLSAINSGIKQLPVITPTPFFAAKVSAAARAYDGDFSGFELFLSGRPQFRDNKLSGIADQFVLGQCHKFRASVPSGKCDDGHVGAAGRLISK